MISLDEACEKAIIYLSEEGYLKGLAGVVDAGDIWIFGGRVFEENVAEYGNCPVAINKETGELYDFPISDMDNYDILEKGEVIPFPDKYKIKVSKK